MTEVHIGSYRSLAERENWLSLRGGPWARAVIKPNWVRHFNGRDPGDARLMTETVTSPRLIADIARQLRGRCGKLVVGDAPQFDAEWEVLWRRLELDGLLAQLRDEFGFADAEIRDLRQEVVATDTNGVIVRRERKNGDPEGYAIVDLGDLSAFAGSGFDFRRLRGADFDAEETIAHHTGGRHEYCIARTVLRSDLVIDAPKAKTHKKAGVTLCLKNLVGINGNKNFLPHHRRGSPANGGDEFPAKSSSAYQRFRAWAIDSARPILARGMFLPLVQGLRRIDVGTRSRAQIRNGNWWGNETVWRMILDLNRILLFADADGEIRRERQRDVFHVVDAIVAGEGDGPLAPDRRDMGMVIWGQDAVAVDFVTAALMGFEPMRIPVIRHSLSPHPLPITTLGPSGEGLRVEYEGRYVREWRELPNFRLRAHAGWAGHIERAVDAAAA